MRVISVFRAKSDADWKKSLASFGVRHMPRWTDLKVSGASETDLNDLLNIKQRGSESYLLDSRGHALHSRMTAGTTIPAVEDALAELASKR